MRFQLAAIAALLGTSFGYPSIETDEDIAKRYNGFSNDLAKRLGTYVPPGPNDSRGPCPALNTLANHALLPHNGKNFTTAQIRHAFMRGFGLHPSAIVVALKNFRVVCEYIKGGSCALDPGQPNTEFLLTNLTILGETHAFEHDHSFSRQDYQEGWANGEYTDNISFNSSVFQTSLDVIGYKPSNPPKKQLANYQEFNQIRLERESIQLKNDYPGFFIESIPTTLFETGYIFGVTYDRTQNGSLIGKEPRVRVDWWNYWFSEESFPTQLGWVPARTEIFNFDFVTKVSKSVLSAPITSTPRPLPSGATRKRHPPPAVLPHQDPSPTFSLYHTSPYRAPTSPSEILPRPTKGSGSDTEPAKRAEITARAQRVNPPEPYDWYRQVMDRESMENQIAMVQSYSKSFHSSMSANRR